jgi:signal transduction histidine kinase
MTENQIKTTMDDALEQKFALLEKEAELINMEFLKVEENLKLLQKQAEYLFAKSGKHPDALPDIQLMQRPQGYRWEPFANPYEQANIFVSASASPKLTTGELGTAKELEPLMMQTNRNNSMLKAVFFCFAESGWIIYPAMNVDYEVAINKLPPDIKVQDYEFYYLADERHNPQKTITWTNPYNDVTHWETVTTALIPVYLPSGKLRGVLGADFPVAYIDDRILHLKFKEPHAFAFIRDKQGHFIAGQKNSLPSALFSQGSLASFPPSASDDSSTARSENAAKGIRKMSTPEGNFYVMFAPISSNGWVLHFVIPESDIIDPVIKNANEQTAIQMEAFARRLLFFLFLGSVTVILFSYHFSRTVTEPVKQLTKATQEIAKGHYRIAIPVTVHDEIGHLTETFNSMNVTIDKLIRELTERANELEERVDERTRALQEANAQLTETFDRLKKSELARTELIVQISHDLKTPLTSIKGYAQLISEYSFSPEQQKEYMQLILFRINHMIQLIEDLFEISRLDVNETYDKECLPIGFILEHALEIVTGKAESTSIQIQCDCPDDLPLVHVDPKKLNRALVNILQNAIKYSRDKGETILQINAFQQDARLLIAITDNGAGIAAENLEKIFTPFYREPQHHGVQIAGSGLGLTIAKKIIEGHQGDISIRSSVGVGTTVTIALPVSEQEWAI